MKKRLLPLLVILLLLGARHAHAQSILEDLFGVNLTQVDGDQFYGFHKYGLNFGPMVIVPFGKKKELVGKYGVAVFPKGELP